MIGDKGVVDHDILAAGPGETGDMPVVVDPIIFARQQVRAEIGQLMAVDVDTAGDCA